MTRQATLADYRWLYDHGYMPDGLKCAREIMLEIVQRCPATFIDYGSGRGHLAPWISTHTSGLAISYDPALHECRPHSVADWVTCCDVLEHIPEAELPATLADIRSLLRRGAIFTVANMSDIHAVGSEQVELHLIQQPPEWWAERFRAAWPSASITHRHISSQRFAFIVDFA